MFAVDHVLVSDAVLDAPFACNLGACLGGCCVHGDSGAPLEAHERAAVKQAAEVLWHDLRPEARDVIRRQGAWTREGKREYATSCVNGAECVFVVYDGPVAKCAIQRAHQRGQIDFPKPISCHLFPIRVETWGDTTVLNYEQVDLCRPAVRHGRRTGVNLIEFLQEPLTRRFGAAFFARLRAASAARAAERAAATAT